MQTLLKLTLKLINVTMIKQEQNISETRLHVVVAGAADDGLPVPCASEGRTVDGGGLAALGPCPPRGPCVSQGARPSVRRHRTLASSSSSSPRTSSTTTAATATSTHFTRRTPTRESANYLLEGILVTLGNNMHNSRLLRIQMTS